MIFSGARTLPHAELFERARRAASALSSMGVRAEDTVALLLRNDFAVFEASYGAMILGAIPTPINWHSTPLEFCHVLEDCGARVLVAHADLLAGVRAVIPPTVKVLVVPTPQEIAASYDIPSASDPLPIGVREWSSWIEQFEPHNGGFNTSRGSMIYTSGTTGRPKGVRRRAPSPAEAAAISALRSLAWGFEQMDPGSIISVMTGPMYHSAMNIYGLAIPRLGGKLILQPRFDAEGLLKLISQQKVTHLHLVPVMFNRLLALPPKVRENYDHGSLKCVVHAAAPVSIAAKRAMIDWWGPIFSEYYGATEIGMVTRCDSREWCARPGTVGRALPGARIAILDEAGEQVPAGTIGEVAVRLDSIADFTYHRDDAKRAQVGRREGLVATGDVGYLDRDNYLFLCDRSADIVISGGVNIYTAEIENLLSALEGIADCAVFGIPDAEYGEKLCAIVQPKPGTALTAAGIQERLRGSIASFKIPRVIEFRAHLGREDSGKLFKRRLRDDYWKGHDRRIG